MESTRLVDLSHVITEGLSTYPGLPAPHVFEHLDRTAAEAFYGEGVTFTIGMITICSNTGTYIDMPYHRFADGHDLTGLPLERVADVAGVCIDCRGIDSIGPDSIAGLELQGTRQCCFAPTTAGTSQHPTTSSTIRTWRPRPRRRWLPLRVACVGIDSLNIDATEGPEGAGRPVHTTLLGNDIPIIEHLTGLDALPRDGFRFTAVPPKIEGLGTFTVRAFAII